jgi:D-hydroxyproline dehydrogenase subunit beta
MRFAVIGAGVLGASVAARLAAAGQQVTLLDQDQPGRATSRWSFAWLNSNDKKPRPYHDLNQAGLRAWAELAPDLDGAAWYRPVGHVELVTSGATRAELAARVQRLASWGYQARLIDASEALELEPSLLLEPAPDRLRVSAETSAAWFPDEGYLLTEPLIERLVARAVSHGADLLTGEQGRVTGLEAELSARPVVRTAAGAVLGAHYVICCAGRWTPGLAVLAGAAGRVPLLPWETPGAIAPGLVVQIGPVSPEGPARLVHAPGISLRPHPGGLLHLEAPDAAVDLHTPDAELRRWAAELLSRARRAVRGLDDARVVAYQVCVRPMPADGQSIVGRLPGAPGVYVAVTHSGVTLAAHLANLITADLTSGSPVAALAPYRLDRFPAAPALSPAAARAEEGDSLNRQSQLPEALAVYEEAVRLDPNVAAAHRGLGWVLFRTGRSPEAEAALREAIRLDPDLAGTHRALGFVLGRLRRFPEAEAAFGEALRLGPDSPNAHHGLGWVLGQTGRSPEAESEFREAIRLDPKLAAAHLALGRVLYQTERYREAEAAFREAVRLEPNLGSAHQAMGWILGRACRYSEAESEFREAIRLDPKLAGAHEGLGQLLYRTRRYPEAEAASREAIRLRPDLAKTHQTLGLVLYWTQRYPEAESAFREAIRLDPKLAYSHDGLGQILLRADRDQEAEAALREAIRLDPSLAGPHEAMGWVLGRALRFPEAEASSREAVRLDPNLASAHDILGRILIRLHRNSEGEAAFREAVRLAPDVPDLYVQLGMVLGGTGRFAEAEAAFREAIRLDPNLADAHDHLSAVLFRTRQFRKGWAASSEAIRLDPARVSGPELRRQFVSLFKRRKE